jgi:putative ABC transport system permease protein
MGSLFADLRYAVRVVLKNPRFSFVAVAALALGIGANAAIFSVVNTVLLQPLPYPDPARMVRVCRDFQGNLQCASSIPKFTTWARAQTMDAMAAYDFAGPGLNLTGGDRPEQVKGIHVSAGYFKVFGVETQLGRTFTPEEDRPGGTRVAVLSNTLWTTHFGSDPQIAGRTISLNGDPYLVVGVLAKGFRPDPPADVFIPLQPDPNSTNQGHFLAVAGRLKPGVSIEAARAEMKVLGDQFRRDNPKWMSKDEQVAVNPMLEVAVRDVRPALMILLGAVGLVLLIACANVANLLLARAAGRQREVAIRAAIGAGRAQIVRQLLTESVLLAFIGGLVGVVAGVWGARALMAFSPGDLPRADTIASGSLWTAVDWRLVLFALAVSLGTGLLFGIAPALHLSRADVGTTLKDAGGRGASGRKAARTRNVLVVAEMALALMLLVSAALLIRTFIGLREVRPGFQAHNVLTLQTSLAGSQFSTAKDVERLTKTMAQRIDALPGVEATAMAITLPTQGGVDLPFLIEGRPLSGNDPFHGDEQWRSISPEYFRALSIPVTRGRAFDDRDTNGSMPVVIINAAFARKYWPNVDPIGQRITIGKGLGPEFEDPTRQVVGVVGDVHENGLSEDAPPVYYVPVSQVADPLIKLTNGVIPASWIVKASSTTQGLVPLIQKEFISVGGQLPVAKVQGMEQVIAKSIAQQNFNMLLLGIFGAIALLLAAIGIYGLMSYSVEQGAHDIGVRLALGAARKDILSMVVSSGMKLAAIGLSLGVVGSFWAARLLTRMLFGVKPTDPATYAVVILTLATVAFLACYLPARRAMRVDPIIALRQE